MVAKQAHLVRTGDDDGKVALLLILSLDNGLDDAGVVRAQVHEAMRHPGFPDGLEEGEGRRVHHACTARCYLGAEHGRRQLDGCP